MEPDIKVFLVIILQTIAILLLWMLLNVFFGIKLGLLFLDGKVTWLNWLYYLLMVASLVWVIRYIIKKWKQMPDFKDGNVEP